MTSWLMAITAAYLIGSIPFGYMIGRARGIDIRQHGSKNIGATNVGRVLGKKFGYGCFVLDLLKGAGPVVGAGLLHGVAGMPVTEIAPMALWLWLGVAIATVLGHMFSPFLGFRGGKGVATGLGALLGLWPLLTVPAIGALVVWLITVKVMRYVSLASVLAACAIPLFCLVGLLLHEVTAEEVTLRDALAASAPVLIVTVLLAALVTWKHRGNLQRIVRGEEPRIGSAVDSTTTTNRV